MTVIEDAYPSCDVIAVDRNVRASMGYVTLPDDVTPIPKCTIAIQDGDEESFIIMPPAAWAKMVADMIELASLVGGRYHELTQHVLAQRPKLN